MKFMKQMKIKKNIYEIYEKMKIWKKVDEIYETTENLKENLI